MKLSPDEAFGLGIVHLGTINKLESAVLKKVLAPGDIVLDIGAYVDGWYTLLAGKLVGKTGQVYSFEPHPLYFQRLEENITLKRLTNVTPVMLGISDRNGTAKFYEAGGASSLLKSQAERFTPIAKEMTIQTCTLNKFLKENCVR